MSIATEISRLSNAKAALKEKIEGTFGVTIPSTDKLDDYPDYFPEIPESTDLSMVDIHGNALSSQSTANCYVCRSAGVYCLPLVYGNGIKNGQTNSAAYTKVSGSYSGDFVNHLGNTITSPYIESNSGCTAASCGLVWTTHIGLFSDISLRLVGNVKYLFFTLSSVPSTNALGVLHVRDSSGRIMWSWTIWVTADNLTPIIFTNATNVQYSLLPENLGAIWAGSGRTPSSGDRYVNPYYQYGRKDGIIPAASVGSTTNMTVYDANGNSLSYTTVNLGTDGIGVTGTFSSLDSSKTIANSIQNPGIFFTQLYGDNNYTWTYNYRKIRNYWNAVQTSTGTNDDQSTAIKTIYDPCPVGYMIPTAKCWSYFSKGNTVGSFSNGYFFKRNSSDTTGNYWAATGIRHRQSGGVYNTDTAYWGYSAYNSNGSSAASLVFNYSSVTPSAENWFSSAFNIRPTVELT